MGRTLLLQYMCFVTAGIVAQFINNDITGQISNGGKIQDTYLKFHPQSLLGCARECILRRRCQAFNYHVGYLYCELAQKNTANSQLRSDTETKDIFYSDVQGWSETLAGVCANHQCGINKTCNIQTGACAIKDCGALPANVEHATIVLSGNHEIGNGVRYSCAPGYVMYDMTGEVTTNVYHVMCAQGGQWEPANFFCKKWRMMLGEFCPPDYVYNKVMDICYKEHTTLMTRDGAEKTCASEKGHLLNLDAENMALFTSGISHDLPVLIDGRRREGVWYNWAGLPVIVHVTGFYTAGDECIGLRQATNNLTAVSCQQRRPFLCQIELCPKTAGYAMYSSLDVCYKVVSPPRPFDAIRCMETVTSSALRDIYRSDVMDRAYIFVYYRIFQSSGQFSYLYVNESMIINDLIRYCWERKMDVVFFNNEETRQRLLQFLRNRMQVLSVGLDLDPASFHWSPVKGQAVNTGMYSRGRFQRLTDMNKCVTITANQDALMFTSVHCTSRNKFLCTALDGKDLTDIELSNGEATYDEALALCRLKNKTLVQLYSVGSYYLLHAWLKDNANARLETTPRYYIGHYLTSKTYSYKWRRGSATSISLQDVPFRHPYSNDTRDAKQSALYYPVTNDYELAAWDHIYHNFVCQTTGLSLWINAVGANNTAHVLVSGRWYNTILVSRDDNMLSYACAVDTTQIIRSMILPRR